MIKVVCMGDSITEGFGVEISESYPSVLQNLLGEEYRVVNKGVCCTTTLNVENEKGVMGMPYMREARYKEALQEKGDIYVVLLGTNDAQDGMDDTQVRAERHDKPESGFCTLLPADFTGGESSFSGCRYLCGTPHTGAEMYLAQASGKLLKGNPGMYKRSGGSGRRASS